MSNKQSIELQSCLSCGDPQNLVIRPDKDEEDGRIFAYHVECETCGARGRNRVRIGWCESEQEAAEAWNDRSVVLNEKALVNSRLAHYYSIEPHGQPGEFALYLGRTMTSHGLRLCQLSDFDRNGETLRADILRGLNTLASL